MLEPVGPVEAHQLEDLEELLEMHVLLCTDDVNHFVKFVLLIPLDGARDVPRQIDGRPVCVTRVSRV